MTTSTPSDPFATLGLPQDAGEAEIRNRYLELVKKYPPDRDPEKFREVRSAFEAVQDPLVIARRLLQPPDEEAPNWTDAIEEQRQIPPPISLELLLSLGNREEQAQAAAGDQSDDAS